MLYLLPRTLALCIGAGRCSLLDQNVEEALWGPHMRMHSHGAGSHARYVSAPQRCRRQIGLLLLLLTIAVIRYSVLFPCSQSLEESNSRQALLSFCSLRIWQGQEERFAAGTVLATWSLY